MYFGIPRQLFVSQCILLYILAVRTRVEAYADKQLSLPGVTWWVMHDAHDMLYTSVLLFRPNSEHFKLVECKHGVS